MATRIASGQITIVDLNDGKAVQAFTSTSQGDTQIYSPNENSYSPNYTSSPFQVVTAKVFVTGSSVDQAPTSACSGWTWKVNGTAVTATGDITFVKNVLTIKRNITTSVKFFNIEWSCVYTDPERKTVTNVQGFKTINLTQSGGSLALVQITQPKGNTFDAENNLTTLTAVAKLYRGSKQDTSVSSIVWKKLNLSTGAWDAVPASSYTTSGGTSTLTVKADDVLNFQSFMCEITDTDGTFSAIATFFDATDPYTVEVYTTTGDVIVNGAGSTQVFARVWRGSTIIEEAGAATPKFNYVWTKYNKAGTATNWDGETSVTKTGNPITVAAADVDVRCTIYCEVQKK